MKTLYIVRHAKSSWEDTDLPDFDRPLNERGKNDAQAMGERLKAKGILPDLIITSSARRARSTCKRIARVIGYDEKRIVEERRLYHAGQTEILAVLQNLSESFNIVMIFGHNPGFTEFANAIHDGEEITDNIPTCGVVAFDARVDSWKKFNFATGRLIFYDYPKRIARS